MTTAETQGEQARTPRPGRIPDRRPNTQAMAIRRAIAGPKVRLTRKVAADLTTAIRSGAPLDACCAFVGITVSTYREWMKVAERAHETPARERDQLQRVAIELQNGARQAMGEAMMRTHAAVAQAAGLTREKPRSRIVRQRIVGATVDENGRVQGGNVAEVIVEDRELPPDWRAAVHLGDRRWPEAMGVPSQVSEPEAVPVGTSQAAVLDRIREIRAAREQAIEAASSPIDGPTMDEQVAELDRVEDEPLADPRRGADRG